MMKLAVHIIGSILLSIPILYVIAGILDVTRLMPGWGFWHGPVIIAWPICVLIAFNIADDTLVSPRLRIYIAWKRPLTTGRSGSLADLPACGPPCLCVSSSEQRQPALTKAAKFPGDAVQAPFLITNGLGRFYSPLVHLDQRYWHANRYILGRSRE